MLHVFSLALWAFCDFGVTRVLAGFPHRFGRFVNLVLHVLSLALRPCVTFLLDVEHASDNRLRLIEWTYPAVFCVFTSVQCGEVINIRS